MYEVCKFNRAAVKVDSHGLEKVMGIAPHEMKKGLDLWRKVSRIKPGARKVVNGWTVKRIG